MCRKNYHRITASSYSRGNIAEREVETRVKGETRSLGALTRRLYNRVRLPVLEFGRCTRVVNGGASNGPPGRPGQKKYMPRNRIFGPGYVPRREKGGTQRYPAPVSTPAYALYILRRQNRLIPNHSETYRVKAASYHIICERG